MINFLGAGPSLKSTNQNHGYWIKWRDIFAHFSAVALELLRKALSVFLPCCRGVQNAGAYVEI